MQFDYQHYQRIADTKVSWNLEEISPKRDHNYVATEIAPGITQIDSNTVNRLC